MGSKSLFSSMLYLPFILSLVDLRIVFQKLMWRWMTEISQKRSLALVALCWSMTFVRIVLNMKTVKYILYTLFVVS